MKLEAFKEFVVPKLDMCFGLPEMGKNLDTIVRKTVQQSLGLPGRTCDTIFCVRIAQGGRIIIDEIGNMMITHAVKMLTSPNPLV